MRADRIYATYYPAISSKAHTLLTAKGALKFELPRSDTLHEFGIAILNHHK